MSSGPSQAGRFKPRKQKPKPKTPTPTPTKSQPESTNTNNRSNEKRPGRGDGRGRGRGRGRIPIPSGQVFFTGDAMSNTTTSEGKSKKIEPMVDTVTSAGIVMPGSMTFQSAAAAASQARMGEGEEMIVGEVENFDEDEIDKNPLSASRSSAGLPSLYDDYEDENAPTTGSKVVSTYDSDDESVDLKPRTSNMPISTIPFQLPFSEPASSESSFPTNRSSRSQWMLFKFPTRLPPRSIPEAPVSSSTTPTPKKSSGEGYDDTLKDIPSGKFGKILRYKSGKMELILQNEDRETICTMPLGEGLQCGFMQQLVSIDVDDSDGKFIPLGNICKSYIVSPDIDSAFQDGE